MASRDDRKRKTLLDEARGHVDKRAFSKAAAAYERALALDPSDLRTMRRLADVYARDGRRDEARRTYVRLADGHERRGMILMAVGALKAALSLDPDDGEAAAWLARCYVALGLTADAVKTLADLAEAREGRGDLGGAIEARQQLVACEPGGLVNALRLADLLALNGDPQQALSAYRGALRQIRADAPRSDTFLRVAERVVELAPDDARLMREIAEVYLARGETSEVVRWLDRSHRVAPQDPETLDSYARLFERTGRNGDRQAVEAERRRLGSTPPGPLEAAGPGEARPPIPAGAGPASASARPGAQGAVAPPPPLRIRLEAPRCGSDLPPPERVGGRRRRSGTPPPAVTPVEHETPPPPPPPIPASSGGGSGPRAGRVAPALAPPPVPRLAVPPSAFLRGVRDTAVDLDEEVDLDDVLEAADLSGEGGSGDVETVELQLFGEDDPSGWGEERDEELEILDELDLDQAGAADLPEDDARSREVERLLAGVQTLLEFDAVERAAEVAQRALALDPGSSRARAMHRLALYRAGKGPAGEGEPSPPSRQDPSEGRSR